MYPIRSSTFVADNWAEKPGTGLTFVAREGTPAPGAGPGVTYGDIDSLPSSMNDAGEVAFESYLDLPNVGTTTDEFALWTDAGGSSSLIARSGAPVSGMPSGFTFDTAFGTPRINNSGSTLFFSKLDGPGITGFDANAILLKPLGGSLQLLLRPGDAAPGTATSFKAILSESQFSDSGKTAFLARLTDGKLGIWSGGAGGFRLVAHTGDSAPGTEAGTFFSEFDDSPAMNGHGETAFVGYLAGPLVTPSNPGALFSEGGGAGLQMVARTGAQAPGTPAGVTFRTFRAQNLLYPLMNNAGQLVFQALVTGSGITEDVNDLGLWRYSPHAGLSLVARTGDQVPDMAPGIVFGDLGASTAINNLGQVAFESNVSSGGPAIWASDITGKLHLIVKVGQQFEVAPGDIREIKSIGFFSESGNDDGLFSGFNDVGQLAFGANFTDGTWGTFVSNAVAVPEPSCLAICTIALCLARTVRVTSRGCRLTSVL